METKLPKEVVLKAVKNCVDVYAHENDFTVDKSIPGYCILTVEGTSSMDDWVTNLKFLIRKDDTHRGFKENAMRTLAKMVLNYESLEKDRVLVVAGHSLGGATATVSWRPSTQECSRTYISSPLVHLAQVAEVFVID
jgi:predicted lipase